jgi:hypothetical protein
LDKAEKKRIRNKLLSQKKQKLVKSIKDKISKMKLASAKKEKKLSIDEIAKVSKLNIFTVENLNLWKIDNFNSKEMNPKQQTYALGKNDEFGNLFFTAKLGQTYGPIAVERNQYYIKLITRNFDADIVESSEKDDLTDIEKKIMYAWSNQNAYKFEAYRKVVKQRANYLRYRKLPAPKQPEKK